MKQKNRPKAEAEKIITDAQAAIERNKMAALTEVKNEIGMLVIEISEKILRRELENKTEQEKYIKQLAEEVKLELKCLTPGLQPDMQNH